MTAKLTTIGLSKRYRDTVALEPIDLTVRAGEFLTLLGPSGSGKTTLLQMISGLVAPTSGQLLIDGVDATHRPAGERGIGMVFQSYALFPHMNVWENVAYGLRMRRSKSSDIKQAVDDALAMVRMQDFAKRYPKELSGGQQQRIALARCFAYRPEIVLLDEPLGALDKKLREHMQVEMRQLHRDLGATFIYVTHDQDEALTLSDRICLMNRARIEQLGTPAELYDAPATRFAADFIGHSNLIAGRVDADSGAPTFRAGAWQLPAPALSSGIGSGESACLLVRPEAAQVVAAPDGLIHGEVSNVMFLGSDSRVSVRLPDSTTFVVRCDRSGAPVLGEHVGVRWDAARSTLLRDERTAAA